MSSITVRVTGAKQRVDLNPIGKLLAGTVPGLILRRVDEGRDINDRPFRAYSTDYRDNLVAVGEDSKVDLRMTGGLLNSVKLRQTLSTSFGLRLVFAPDAGTSPVRAFVVVDGVLKLQTTGKRGPPHNVVGYWLHHGTARMKARPWMGLSPRDRAVVARLLNQFKRGIR